MKDSCLQYQMSYGDCNSLLASDLQWLTVTIDEYNAPSLSCSCARNLDDSNGTQQINQIEGSSGSDTEDIVKKVIAVLKEKRNPELKCELCNKSGHTIEQCFFNPDNPNNRLTQKMRKAMSTNKNVRSSSGSSSKSKIELAGSILESISVQPSSDRRTYADSAATSHCFHSPL